MTTAVVGPGQLHAAISAHSSPATANNTLASIRVTAVNNATATLNGNAVGVGQTVNLPAGTTQITLVVQRHEAGRASTVNFVVTDVCGEWSSFVGGGPGAF